MPLSRRERERLVLDLYNQGKNIREIAQEVRMSFSAIGTILKKEEQENETSKEQTEKMSQAAQAYKLFSDGKSPVDVAITLNLRQAEVTEFYREYWKLKQLYDLSQVYEEIKGDIHSFVNLYRLIKSAGMNSPQVIRLLTIANNHLPSVEQRCENLNREVASLEGDKCNSAMILQELSDEISYLRNTLEQHESSCKELRLELDNLNREYRALKELVNDFQDNNDEYIKFTRAVEDKVFGVLSDRKALLRYALLSITESIRNSPERFRSLFYNMPFLQWPGLHCLLYVWRTNTTTITTVSITEY
jgi:transposase